MFEPQNGRKEIRFLSVSENTLNIRMLGYNDFRKIESWKFFRVYSWDTIHYVIRGSGKLFIRGKEYDISAGDFFFIPKNEAVMYYASTDAPWCYYWICFNSESSLELGKKTGLDADSPVRKAKNPAQTQNIFDRLFIADVPMVELYYKVCAAVMEIISMEYASIRGSDILQSSKDELVENAKKLIKLNYTRNEFSIPELANMLYVSPRHLSRLFHEYVGMTPVAYLAEIRLTAAADILRSKSMTVSELCRAVGWGDELYFMKKFKKKFALTVGEWREKMIAAKLP
ncbi:MAG: AraC family transcriptional regulator [Ruminococcaceae bacterium]|nr:AraC family transcriptional regulator [Oscillospiraceae bacterium]